MTSTHALLVPTQCSACSSSFTSPCEAPVQLVDAEAKPSTGHAPDVPVQVSATSHWPAEARHVWLAAWKTSTHELSVARKSVAEGLSHAPPCDAPVQMGDAEAKPSAGHAPYGP